MSDVYYAGKWITATDGTEFIIVTDNAKISYMNVNICEVPTQWFSTYESMMEHFNLFEPKAKIAPSMRKIITEEENLNLPLPRLQLSYHTIDGMWKEHIIRYDLVYRHLVDGIVLKPMGATHCTQSHDELPLTEDGKLFPAFRDGAHIRHDSVELNLPAYAVCGDIVETIK